MNKKFTGNLIIGFLSLALVVSLGFNFLSYRNNQLLWTNMMRNDLQDFTYSRNDSSFDNSYRDRRGSMGGMMGSYSRYGDFDDDDFTHMDGMMGSYYWGYDQEYDKSELKEISELKENVEKYLDYYDGDFEIEDIFVYSNSDYYFSIVEEATGRGAMELLVNPVTGAVYPEFGPNMMWNTKYGMHSSNGYGMMRMMDSFFNDFDEEDAISKDEALNEANDYLKDFSDNLVAEDGGHAFYGYYTFHIVEDDEVMGMLSVNAYTGDVWFHKWHGDLIEIISDRH